MSYDFNDFKTKIEANKKIVDEKLKEYFLASSSMYDSDFNVLYESMRYSALSDGKRIRSFLALEFFKLYSSNIEIILPFACAIELIHTYSLIHDDLPCMDDDDFRRGQPTNHKKYGEAVALLSGDALLTLAFNIISSESSLSSEKTLRVIKELSDAVGHKGMIGGQVMDINDNKNIDIVRLIKLNTLKTGNLLIASSRTGCIAGDASEHDLDVVTDYTKNLGIAFQITDDILDVKGNSAVLGKNTGSDKKNNKINFVSKLGLEEAENYAKNLSAEAIMTLDKIKKPENAETIKTLEDLVKYLLEREK